MINFGVQPITNAEIGSTPVTEIYLGSQLVWPQASPVYSDYTTFLAHMNGANGSAVFLDSSANVFPITPVGTAQISTAQYKFGGSSGYFDGTSGNLTVPYNDAFDFGTGDFTVEGWFYFANLASPENQTLIMLGDGANGSGPVTTGWDLQYQSSTGQINFLYYDGVTLNIYATSGLSLTANTWYFIAVSRAANVLKIFVNGVAYYTGTVTQSFSAVNTANPLRIGLGYHGPGADHNNPYYFPGYVDDVRITKGVARYLTNFVPPRQELINPFDPYINNVSLLLYMNGINASTTFIDSSLNSLAVTANGGAQISTAQSKFGGASGAFNGSSAYLELADTSDQLLLSGDFTIECWVYFNSLSGTSVILQSTWIGIGGALALWVHSSYPNKLSLWADSYSADVPIIAGTTTLTTGTWYHVAATRSGNNWGLFVNGIPQGTTTSSASVTRKIRRVGAYVDNTGFTGAYLNGYIDDLRITKGVVRYPKPTVSPSNGYDDAYYSNVSLLLHMNGANGSTTFTDNSLNAFAVTPVNSAQISTAQSRFGGASGYFDGAGAYIITPPSNAFNFGTSDFTIEAWVYFVSVASDQRVAGGDLVNSTGNLNWAWYTTSTGTLSYFLSTGAPGQWDITGGYGKSMGTISSNQWYHVALVRTGNVFTPYLNGAAGTTTTSASSIGTNSTNGPVFGKQESNYFNGYVDDVRITKGVARYTSNFTPPAAQFANSTFLSNTAPFPAPSADAYIRSLSPVAWYDFSDVATVTSDPGTGLVTAVLDKGSSHTDFTNYNPASGVVGNNQHVSTWPFNGKPCINLNYFSYLGGNSTVLFFGDIFVVMYNNWGGDDFPFQSRFTLIGNNENGGGRMIGTPTGFYSPNGARLDFSPFGTYIGPNPVYYENNIGPRNFASNSASDSPFPPLNNNPVLMRITASSLFGWGPYTSTPGLSLGMAWGSAPGAVPWYGDIGELVFFDKKLTPAEVTRLQQELAAKWAITLSP
jgi:hypothetical protein